MTTTAPSTEKIEAIVTGFGRIQPSRYRNEQVQSVLFERRDRQDESRKVWKTFNVDEARQFHRNQPVLLIPTQHNNRQSWLVERIDASATQASPPYPKRSAYQEPKPQFYPVAQPPQSSLSPGQKQEIATWIGNQADLYAFCFNEATRALANHQPEEETVRACASSLFISATRKFRLET